MENEPNEGSSSSPPLKRQRIGAASSCSSSSMSFDEMAARNVQLEQQLQSAEEEIARLKDDNKELKYTVDQLCKKEDVQRMKVDLLFTACESGDVNNASRLLAALPEVNLNTIKWSEDDAGELTLLTHAAKNGHAEICQLTRIIF